LSEVKELLIEKWFPIQECNIESARERGAQFPPLYRLHVYWTRKPQAASRIASILASLPAVKLSNEFMLRLLRSIGFKFLEEGSPEVLLRTLSDEKTLLKEFTREHLLLVLKKMARDKKFGYSQLYSASPNIEGYIRLFEKVWGRRPIGGDFMAGGGSIPFEMLRSGYSTVIAGEYNPVAYLILKAAIEYPLKYGEQLVKDVKNYAKDLLNELKESIKEYYPQSSDRNEQPKSYIWVRTFKCPKCGLEIPAVSSFWLDREKGFALYPTIDGSRVKLHVVKVKILEEYKVDNRKEAKVQIIEGKFKGRIFKTEGYEKGGSLRCPNQECPIIQSEELKSQYTEYLRSREDKGYRGVHRARLIAVQFAGRIYTEPTDEIIKAYCRAEEDLKRSWNKLVEEELIPLEEIPVGEKTIEPMRWGLTRWYQLFNARQLLIYSKIVYLIRKFYEKILFDVKEKFDEEAEDYAKAIVTYLTIAFGKLLDYNSTLTSWIKDRGVVEHTFKRHAYTWTWEFVELDITQEKASFGWALNNVLKSLSGLVEQLKECRGKILVTYGDATETTLKYMPKGGFDVLFTDPPYYGSIQHGELSDFFYVWYRLILRDLYPEAFSEPLVPKEEEAVYNKVRMGKPIKVTDKRRRRRVDVFDELARKWYEDKLRDIFKAHYNALRNDGVFILWFAHKASEAWVKTIKALLDVGFVITAIWGVRTEMARSLHIVGRAALRTSLLIVARKLPRNPSWLPEVLNEIKRCLPSRLSELERLQVWGPDFLMAAMAEGLRVASRYWPVRDPLGKLSPDDILDKILSLSTMLATSRILRRISPELVGIDAPTKFYILARRLYGDIISYDDARRLALAVLGTTPTEDPVNLVVKRSGLCTDKTVEVEGERVKAIKLLDPWDRVRRGMVDRIKPIPLIDYIHKAISVLEAGGSITKAAAHLAPVARDAFMLLRVLNYALPDEVVIKGKLVRNREKVHVTTLLHRLSEEELRSLIEYATEREVEQETLDKFLKGSI